MRVYANLETFLIEFLKSLTYTNDLTQLYRFFAHF